MHARSALSNVSAAPGGIALVAWAPHAARSAALAQSLNARCHCVHVLAFQRPLIAPLKYPMQAALTWYVLWRDRPCAVVVQNPPPLAVACVAVYCRLTGARFVIDSHSSALVDKKWTWSLGLQRWLGRHAVASLIHTATLRPQLHSAGRVLVLEDPPPVLDEIAPPASVIARRVVVVGSFAADEPIDVVLDAARALPSVEFILTGNPGHAAKPARLANLPRNVALAGWLAYNAYIALLRTATVVVSLTTRDLTVLRGAWDALYLSKPLVTSDWPAQRACFVRGTTFVRNDVPSLVEGLCHALLHHDVQAAEMACLATDKRAAWAAGLRELKGLLSFPGGRQGE